MELITHSIIERGRSEGLKCKERLYFVSKTTLLKKGDNGKELYAFTFHCFYFYPSFTIKHQGFYLHASKIEMSSTLRF